MHAINIYINLQISSEEATTLEVDIVMQLFSTLFISQSAMINERKNPYKSITCDNGFVFVFQHVSD